MDSLRAIIRCNITVTIDIGFLARIMTVLILKSDMSINGKKGPTRSKKLRYIIKQQMHVSSLNSNATRERANDHGSEQHGWWVHISVNMTVAVGCSIWAVSGLHQY